MKPEKLPVVAAVSALFIGLSFGVVATWSSTLAPALQDMREFSSHAALQVFFSPTHPATLTAERVNHSQECFLNSADRPLVGWSDVRAQLGMPVRLAGYGIWPFWEAPFSGPSTGKGAADQVDGDLLVLRAGASVWVLVTLDTLGVPSLLAARLRTGLVSDVQAALKASTPFGNSTAECVMVSIVASHSHSSPDLTGIWGGSADSWSSARNQDNARAYIYEPLLASLREAVGRSIAKLLPARITVDHGFYATAATAATAAATSPTGANKGDMPQSLSSGANLTRIWIERDSHGTNLDAGAAPAQKKAVVWIWNGHPATDPRSNQPGKQSGEHSGQSEFGDFPAEVRQALGADLHSFFLPGVIAGDYPIERSGWRNELIGHVSQPPKQRPGSFSIRLLERDYCLESENRLRPPLERWSRFGGGDGLAECTEAGPNSGKSSFMARFQSVRIQVGEKHELEPLEIAFLPFETFADVESQARHATDHDLRVVSLANGFNGHGLAKKQFDSLLSGAQESNRAKPYHLFLAIRTNIEDVTNIFLGENQR